MFSGAHLLFFSLRVKSKHFANIFAWFIYLKDLKELI